MLLGVGLAFNLCSVEWSTSFEEFLSFRDLKGPMTEEREGRKGLLPGIFEYFILLLLQFICRKNTIKERNL